MAMTGSESLTATIKYLVPNRYDAAPFGTICKVISDKSESFYVQVSNDKEHADWIRLGTVFEKAFKDYMFKPEFVNECLLLYTDSRENTETNTHASFTKLGNILLRK